MPATLELETLRQEDDQSIQQDPVSRFKKKKANNKILKKYHLTDSWEMTSGLYKHASMCT